MKVSVVMSCYNSEKYVATAIESILAQTYKDFEFIIWNDGSTDDTEKIVKSFTDKRIRYFYHENTGLGMALKLACEQARGEYIARMDADDFSLPNRFEVETKYLDMHPRSVLVSSAVNYIDDNDSFLNSSFPFTNHFVIKKRMMSGVSVIVHPAAMFRRNVYEKVGGYAALKKAQDSLLFCRMMKYGYLSNISEPLLNYRISENSISTQTDGGPYASVIIDLRLKMIHDEDIHEQDVTIYNDLVCLAKNSNKANFDMLNKKRKQKAKYEYLYNVMAPFIGVSATRCFIINAKNLFALFN